MKVNNIDNTNFTSRNKTIRYADDIARKAHNLYNTISASRIACFNDFDSFQYFKDFMLMKVMYMRQMKDKLYNCSNTFYKKIEALINPIKIYKIANCGEKAHIASIMAKINGIKDCHIAHLYKSDGRNLDHAVVFVNDKKPYVIDAWLGFADYVPNALLRYKKEYCFFDIKEEDTIGFVSKCDDEFTDLLKNNFTRKQRREIKKLYPEMKLK